VIPARTRIGRASYPFPAMSSVVSIGEYRPPHATFVTVTPVVHPSCVRESPPLSHVSLHVSHPIRCRLNPRLPPSSCTPRAASVFPTFESKSFSRSAVIPASLGQQHCQCRGCAQETHHHRYASLRQVMAPSPLPCSEQSCGTTIRSMTLICRSLLAVSSLPVAPAIISTK